MGTVTTGWACVVSSGPGGGGGGVGADTEPACSHSRGVVTGAESQSKHSSGPTDTGVSVCPTPRQAPSSVAMELTSFSRFCPGQSGGVCLEEAEGSALAGFSNPDFQGVQLHPRCPHSGCQLGRQA